MQETEHDRFEAAIEWGKQNLEEQRKNAAKQIKEGLSRQGKPKVSKEDVEDWRRDKNVHNTGNSGRGAASEAEQEEARKEFDALFGK